MKKRFGIMATIFMLVFLLCGCNNSSDLAKGSEKLKDFEFSLHNINKINNWCEYRFLDVKAEKRIEPSMPGEYFSYYEITDEEIIYLAATFEIENISNKVLTVDDIMQVGYDLGEESFGAFATVETIDKGNFEYANMIKLEPKAKATVVYLAKVPVKNINNKINIKVNVKGKLYENNFILEEMKKEKEYIDIGESVIRSGYTEALMDALEYKDKVEPSNPSDDFKHYSIDNTKEVYLVLSSTIKNLQAKDVKGDRLMSAVIYLNEVKYQPSIIIEIEEGSNLTYAKDIALKENDEEKILYVFKVPKSIQGEDVEVSINIYGERYYMKVPD